MHDQESASRLGEISPPPGTSPASTTSPGNWWRHRYLRVPVAVWILASVLGGAAIGNALEPDRGPDERPTTSDAVADAETAVSCDANYGDCVPVSSDADCAGTEEADHDGPTFVSTPIDVVGNDIYELDPDHNGIACD